MADNSPPVISESNRECGECTACCTTHGVAELGKPFFAVCEHICGQGCGIYASRPQTCRDFKCFWLHGFIASPRYRPDKLGWVFTADETSKVLKAFPVSDESVWDDKVRRVCLQLLDRRLQRTAELSEMPIEVLRLNIQQYTELMMVQIYPYGSHIRLSFPTIAPYPVSAATRVRVESNFVGKAVDIDGSTIYEMWFHSDSEHAT